MLQPRLISSTGSSSTSSLLLSLSLSRLTISPISQQTRHASHASQGVANKAAPGPGKRLGAKKGDSEAVVPGNIIFRQRGSLWFPGENCVMGRDHTISSLAKGFVRYYRDPELYPKRKYIGVVFDRSERLPRGRNSARKRRLGMFEREMEVKDPEETKEPYGPVGRLTMNENYQYRESNWSIGRTAEWMDQKPVKRFDPRDRWAAWKRSVVRREKLIAQKALRRR